MALEPDQLNDLTFGGDTAGVEDEGLDVLNEDTFGDIGPLDNQWESQHDSLALEHERERAKLAAEAEEQRRLREEGLAEARRALAERKRRFEEQQAKQGATAPAPIPRAPPSGAAAPAFGSPLRSASIWEAGSPGGAAALWPTQQQQPAQAQTAPVGGAWPTDRPGAEYALGQDAQRRVSGTLSVAELEQRMLQQQIQPQPQPQGYPRGQQPQPVPPGYPQQQQQQQMPGYPPQQQQPPQRYPMQPAAGAVNVPLQQPPQSQPQQQQHQQQQQALLQPYPLEVPRTMPIETVRAQQQSQPMHRAAPRHHNQHQHHHHQHQQHHHHHQHQHQQSHGAGHHQHQHHQHHRQPQQPGFAPVSQAPPVFSNPVAFPPLGAAPPQQPQPQPQPHQPHHQPLPQQHKPALRPVPLPQFQPVQPQYRQGHSSHNVQQQQQAGPLRHSLRLMPLQAGLPVPPQVVPDAYGRAPDHQLVPAMLQTAQSMTVQLPLPRKNHMNLMTPDEMDQIIRLQLAQIHTENPYVDDFYFQAVLAQRSEHAAAHFAPNGQAQLHERPMIGTGERRRQFRDGVNRSMQFYHNSISTQFKPSAAGGNDGDKDGSGKKDGDGKKDEHRSIFEGALGRPPNHSVRAPRALLQLPVMEDDADASGGGGGGGGDEAKQRRRKDVDKAAEQQRRLRQSIEQGYMRVYEIEDIERTMTMLSRLASEQAADSSERLAELSAARTAVVDALHAGLNVFHAHAEEPAASDVQGVFCQQDEAFIHLALIRKGHKLIARALPILAPVQMFQVLLVLLRNLCVFACHVIDFPDELLAAAATMIASLPAPALGHLIKEYVRLAQAEELVVALRASASVSVVRAMFERCDQLLEAATPDAEQLRVQRKSMVDAIAGQLASVFATELSGSVTDVPPALRTPTHTLWILVAMMSRGAPLPEQQVLGRIVQQTVPSHRDSPAVLAWLQSLAL